MINFLFILKYPTCKLGHVWLKIKLSQVLGCSNFVIIQTHCFLKVAQVIIDASIIQLQSSITGQMTSKDLSVNSMCPVQGSVVFGYFLTHKITEDWQQNSVQANPDHNPSLLVLPKIKTAD